VTNFCQNRLTLNGRSASQRHTDTQRDSQAGGGGCLLANCAPSSECPQFGMPPSFDRCTLPRRRFNQNIPLSVVLLQQCHCRNCHRGKLKNLSPPSVLFESSPNFFLQYTGDTAQKMTDQNFEIRIVVFENFLKFSNRHRAVSLRPIWTIMAAAKLDHSRVLVTKFHQNRSTLKGRSASQRHTHTDRQAGRQTNRQIRLKIMARQVCNRANRQTGNDLIA